ncbi:glycoside hydrolase family 65 [candidate division KSB1 bacterium]|nr:glycoside hydrolase family 65 [candidate division KSB1 bacterium]
MHFFLGALLLFISCNNPQNHIDRYALVHRQLPTCNAPDSLSPFSVGNGDFAFTADVTGLQTLNDYHKNALPLVTQSNWGWHTAPNINNYTYEQTWSYVDTYGRTAPYSATMKGEAAGYLRANPHRLHLGRVGFKNAAEEFAEIDKSDLSNINQTLDIWQGIIKSSFAFNGQQVDVETCAHPEIDQIAVRLQAADLQQSALAIGFDFPYASLQWGKDAADWGNTEKHMTTILESGQDFVSLKRQMDATVYLVDIRWQGEAEFKNIAEHAFVLFPKEKERFQFTCTFSPEKQPQHADTEATFTKAKDYWEQFWNSGGAVDLSKSTHPQALEMERRIVLSQYLTAIQCSSSLPPQETGLTANSWFGKFHLEMHWWHAVHFALWGRPEMLEKSMGWYEKILPVAREKAEQQGYDGVRWPKMTSPDGHSSPSSVGEFLIWQQPHPIYFAELLYRTTNDKKLLERYKNIVFQSADFMASYAHWVEAENRYVLGPPLIPAQEVHKALETMNPAFELSYWSFGLKTAQKWRERLGLPAEKKWQHVIDHLSTLPINNGFYQNVESDPRTFQDPFHRNDHPTLLGACGMLPNDSVDVAVMRKTLEQVMVSWNWERTWGWDYPLVAMTAARVGRPDIAIEALLMDVPKNTYLNNGHNYQADRLPLYLPGNGGLLSAIAMMAAGWDGAPDDAAPGFPKDGQWIVEYEGLRRLP